MEIEYEKEQSGTTRKMKSIPINTVFSGKITFLEPASVYLKSCGCVVDLGDPNHVWFMKRAGDFVVYNYRELKARVVVMQEE